LLYWLKTHKNMKDFMKVDYIRTFTGTDFTVFDPKPEQIFIEDIAHALSQLCRYGGHCDPFYSVAQHSIIASYLIEPKFALDALCHDFSEAYIMDLLRPIKYQIPEFINIENKIYEVIAQKFNLTFPIPEEVHIIDNDMIKYEWDFFMSKKPNEKFKDFYQEYFKKTTIEETKKILIHRFYELSLKNRLKQS